MEQVFTTEGSLLTLELRVFSAVIALYVLSCVLHVSQAGISVFFRNFLVGRAATKLLLLAVIGHTVLILIRGVEQGQPPVQSKYECLSWFAWCNCITYLYIRRRWSDLSMPGIFVTILSIAALFLAVNKYSPVVTPIAPALQSPWYFWHVLIAFGAYAV
ncbi:MAG: hypothetical protein V3W00_03960, partial [Candidatus Brocadiales bacterium]